MRSSTVSLTSMSASPGRSRRARGIRLSTLFAISFALLLSMTSAPLTTSARQSSPASKTPIPRSSTHSEPAPSSSARPSPSTGGTDLVMPPPSAATRPSSFDLVGLTPAPSSSSSSSTIFISAPSLITGETSLKISSGKNTSKKGLLYSGAGRRKSLTTFVRLHRASSTRSPTSTSRRLSSHRYSEHATTRTSTHCARRRSSWRRSSPSLTAAAPRASALTWTASLCASRSRQRRLTGSRRWSPETTRWSFTRASWAKPSRKTRSATSRIGSATTV